MTERVDQTTEEQAYDSGWNLAEMGHTDMMDAFKEDPILRAAFEKGWAAGVRWRQEKDT